MTIVQAVVVTANAIAPTLKKTVPGPNTPIPQLKTKAPLLPNHHPPKTT